MSGSGFGFQIRVWGFRPGFQFSGSGFGFRISDSGFRFQLRFRVLCSVSGVRFGFWVSGPDLAFGFRVWHRAYRVWTQALESAAGPALGVGFRDHLTFFLITRLQKVNSPTKSSTCIYYYQFTRLVDEFVGGLTFSNYLMNTLCEIRVERSGIVGFGFGISGFGSGVAGLAFRV